MNSLDKMPPFVQPQVASQHKLTAPREIKQTEESSRAADKLIQADKITISPEARTKVAEESSEERSRNALHDLATKGQEETAVDKESEVQSIDSMIEELQEKISDLMQQIAKLKAQGDEASLEQQKALEIQLAALNSQLMELTSRKMEMLEFGN